MISPDDPWNLQREDENLVAYLFRIGDEQDRQAGHLNSWSSMGADATVRLKKTIRSFDGDTGAEVELDSAVASAPPAFREQVGKAINRGLPYCESAIEKFVLPWLVAQEYQCFDYNPAVLLAGEQASYVPRTVAVVPQLRVGRYRADFALAASRGGLIRFVMVECDGAEFHDGVRNVVKDVDRDVAILSNPRVLEIVRLSGKEIFQDPRKAAASAAKALIEAWSVTNRAMDAKFGTVKR